MKRETHVLALSIASKVAVSMTLIGCDRSAAEPTKIVVAPTAAATTTTGTPTAAATAEPAPTQSQAQSRSASASRPQPAQPASCEKVLEGINALPFDQPLSAEGQRCCEKVMASKSRRSSPSFRACCERLSPDPIVAGCQPWGPPVPPEMVTRSSRSRSKSKQTRRALDLRASADLKAARQRLIDANVQTPASSATRNAAISTWRGRMINEHSSATVFEQLAMQIELAAMRIECAGIRHSLDVVDEVRAFSDEERRHGSLCGAVVEVFGGRAEADESLMPAKEPFPLHEDAVTPIEGVLRNVLSICCLSETVAVALIGAERIEMPDGPLRDLLTEIWADEVGHARFGWRLVDRLLHLGEMADADAKTRLADYLEVAFAHLVEHELKNLPTTAAIVSEEDGDGAAYGLCDGRDARALFFATVEEVIVPNLEARGIPARRAWTHATT